MILQLQKKKIGLQLKFDADGFPCGEVPCIYVKPEAPEILKYMIAQYEVSKSETVWFLY